jgi:hypothetical protein
MRDIETIKSELRLLAAVRRTAAEVAAPALRIGPVDELLDEWMLHHFDESALSGLSLAVVFDLRAGRVHLDRLDALLGIGLRLVTLAGSDDLAVRGLQVETELTRRGPC